ncbi:MAG: O-acetyl-ADP-ribose deacetylase [Deltaproteobacteria bacterium]|nr:O-acetyl-ADP-ribose deacetylase [Deltaproteobacteria bacterium]
MSDELKVKQSVIRLTKGDITGLQVEAIVFYARPDLLLGSGFGGVIATRGGPKIQEELKKIGAVNVTEAMVTSAGNLKAKYIIHAVGPRFQEEKLEEKLRSTMLNALRRAEENKIRSLALPAMGVGFYGIPLEVCARETLGTAKEYLESPTELREVIFCLSDSREMKAFQDQIRKMVTL